MFAAEVVDANGSTDIIAAFRQARETDYAALKTDAHRLVTAARRNGRRGGADRAAVGRALRTIRERFSEIDRIDFFHARGRDELLTTIAAIERLIQPAPQETMRAASSARAADYVKRRGVTRPRPGVDRMASAWLIRHFIDPKATFGFVAKPAPSDVAFDMYEGEFSHQGPYCTFEVLSQRFGITAPSVIRVGHIVHDLDMKQTRYAVAEAPAVERMIEGLRELHRDDHALLEAGIAIFEALARSFDVTPRSGDQPRARPRKSPRRSRS